MSERWASPQKGTKAVLQDRLFCRSQRPKEITLTVAPKASNARTWQARGGLTRSDSFLRFLSGTSEAIMLPI
ncbi:hypothetical protein DIJ61_32725 [Burkholderia pseudomallei]|nr:hypothetical protein DIJ61_32725 [Burkholderia pseudomallei]